MSGQCILVPRSHEQADEFCAKLEKLGARTIAQPAIVIRDPADWGPVDRAIERLEDFEWVVFSSVNGVRYFCDRILATLGDTGQETLKACRLAAIGPSTAAVLRNEFGQPVDLVPKKYRAEELAEGLSQDAPGKRFLLIRASRGRTLLADRLKAAGADVTEVVAYTSEDTPPDDLEVLRTKRQILDNQVNWVTVTSSAIARSLITMYGEALRNVRLVSISPITSQTLRDLGFEPTAEATVYTTDGIIDAIVNHRD
jgi:uroporphyrinogen III methyltransferase/synthase